MTSLSNIAEHYGVHKGEVLSFLQRCRHDATLATRDNIIPCGSIDEVFKTYRVAQKKLEESAKIKSSLSLYENKSCTPIHKFLTTLVEKQHALDEKIMAKNSNFVGPLAMILFGIVAIPVGLIGSFSWVITAGIVSLVAGYSVIAFNIYHYKNEDEKMIHEFSLILTLIRNIRNEPIAPSASNQHRTCWFF